MLALPSRKQEV